MHSVVQVALIVQVDRLVLVHARVVPLLLLRHGELDQLNVVLDGRAIDEHVQIRVQTKGTQLKWRHELLGCSSAPWFAFDSRS